MRAKERLIGDVDTKKESMFNIERFVDEAKKLGMRPRTVKKYCYWLFRLEKSLPSSIKNPQDITMTHISDFAVSEGTSTITKTDIRRRSFVYCSLRKYFEVNDIAFSKIQDEFMKISNKTRHPRHKPVKFKMPEKHLIRFVNAVKYSYSIKYPESGVNDKIKTIPTPLNESDMMQMKCLIRILYYCGCRISEMLLIYVNDVDFDDSPVPIVIPEEVTKTSEERVIYLNRTLAKDLKNYIKITKKQSDDYIFNFMPFEKKDEKVGRKTITLVNREISFLDYQFKKYIKESGLRIGYVKKGICICSCHKMRHAYSHWLEDLGYTLEQRRRKMGHSDISTTAKYTLEEDKEFKDKFIEKEYER